MIQYFIKPYERSDRNKKVEMDLSSYAARAYLKGGTGLDTSNLATQ